MNSDSYDYDGNRIGDLDDHYDSYNYNYNYNYCNYKKYNYNNYSYNYNTYNQYKQQKQKVQQKQPQRQQQTSASGALTQQFEQWHLSDDATIAKEQEKINKQRLKQQKKEKKKKLKQQQQQHLQTPIHYALQQARPTAQQNDYGRLLF